MIRSFSAARRELAAVILRSRTGTGVVCRRCWTALASSDHPTEDDPIDHHSLLSSVHQGQYKYVMSVWEREKELGQADPALYTIVMAMCEHMKSAELAAAVKADMEGQNWQMSTKCGMHYLRALLSEGKVEEALDFAKESYAPNTKEGDEFLLECCKAFQGCGHMREALMVCDLRPTATTAAGQLLPACVALDVVRVECLGALQDSQALLAFMDELCGGDLECPVELRAALVGGLALADRLDLALENAGRWFSKRGGVVMPVKCLALLLESAARHHNYRVAASLHHQHWDATSRLLRDDFKALSTERSEYLLRAVNACVHLQALQLKNRRWDLQRRSESREVEEGLRLFAGRDFHQCILDHSLVPNSKTLEAMLLHACFEESSRQRVESIIKAVVRNGENPDPNAFTTWARHCGRVFPTPRIRKVILQIRMLLHGYNVPLGYTQCQDLISIQYFNTTDQQKLDASQNVRIVERMMKSNGLLSDICGWNILISGHLRAGHLKHMYSTLRGLAEEGLKPDLDTFKALASGLHSMGDHHACVLAAYNFWREFTKEYPRLQPDLEFLNVLIGCCRKCRHVERGLFFLGVVEQCGLKPDLGTYTELLMMLSECNEKEKFQTVLKMARESLADEPASLEALVADCELKWKAEVDADLVSDIIFGSTKLAEQSAKQTNRTPSDY